MKKVLCLLILLLSLGVCASAAEVRVSVPTFPVKLFDTAIDSANTTYPLIVYQDITYFPMTYDYCCSMGLTAQWEDALGLAIAKTAVWAEVPAADYARKNSGSYSATIPTYPILLNGRRIDNATEPYPLLNFRGITYFPLTWQFVHDEFALCSDWDAQNGLWIHYLEDGNGYMNTELNGYFYGMKEGAYGYQSTDYRLDTATQTLVEQSPPEDAWPWPRAVDYGPVEDAPVIAGHTMTWRGVSIDISDIAAWLDTGGDTASALYVEGDALMSAYANVWEDEKTAFATIWLYYNIHIPAPYTPAVSYLLVQDKASGAWSRIAELPQECSPQAVFRADHGYYLYNTVGHGRFADGSGVLLYYSGGTVRDENARLGYADLRPFGYADGKLYLTAHVNKRGWNGPHDVLPLYDGVYAMREDAGVEWEKIRPYAQGSAMLGDDGVVYYALGYRCAVVNCQTGAIITPK